MNLERLHILWVHLMYGTLGHEVFDFNNYNIGFKINYKRDTCGTNGCDMGECPIIWDEWIFLKDGNPSVNKYDTISSGMEWFGLDYHEYEHLFRPCSQNIWLYGGETLGIKATRYQAANNIKAFIDECYKGES